MFSQFNFHGINLFMKCIIIASGTVEYTRKISKTIKSAQLIVCADGGARHLKALDISPHVLIGDFDSIQKDDLLFYQKKNVEIISFSPKKNQTDSELCVNWALENSATDITMIGVTGTRMDHTLANILLLKKLAQKNIPARIINPNNEIFAVMKKTWINGSIGELLSIIPITEKVAGVTLKGLEYPLKNETIPMGSSLGISNVFKETSVCVDIKEGILLVTKSKD